MRLRPVVPLVPALAVVSAAAATAKKNNPNIDLDFRPQQTVAGAIAEVSGAMLDVPATLRFTDDRRGDPAKIGTRTDDHDQKHILKATGDVAEFIERYLRESAANWGVQIESGQSLVLEVRLLEADLLETNQAVGATYNGTVRLAFKLTRGGSSLVSGSASGDATRYGKKFSNANCNEVLSDAMLEAFAALFSKGNLQGAWGE